MKTTTIEEVFDLRPGEGGFHNALDLHDVSIDSEGRFTLRLKASQHLLNPKGIIHGGALFALCDCAVGTYLEYHERWAVTLDSTIHFYRPALAGDTLVVEVTPRKSGRTISTFQVDIHNDEQQHVAEAIFTAYRADES